MGQHIADEVEEDIKREEREKEYLDEEEKEAFDAENKKALQARQKRRGYTKGEFEGSDEEKPDGMFDTSDAYSKPSRGGGKP
jgi:hypothetical protein|tara:strand:- start:291 stop:536 length:246 start_codon:yes stop_codon:yes gene_type:complete